MLKPFIIIPVTNASVRGKIPTMTQVAQVVRKLAPEVGVKPR